MIHYKIKEGRREEGEKARSRDISTYKRKEEKVEELARTEDATEEGWKKTKKKELRKDVVEEESTIEESL